MAAFIMLSLVVWPYQDVKDLPDGRWGKTANSMYYALGGQGGPAWGVGLALMTIALKYMNEDTENDGNGQKSMVKALLSLEIWQPLNKLCFVMYLVHELMVFDWWQVDSQVPAYYDEWGFVLNSFGFWCLTAFAGLILWFVMEKPLANMVTMFMAWILGFGQKRSSNAKYEAVDEAGGLHGGGPHAPPGSHAEAGRDRETGDGRHDVAGDIERSGGRNLTYSA